MMQVEASGERNGHRWREETEIQLGIGQIQREMREIQRGIETKGGSSQSVRDR